jgi:hypothetical protein
MFKSSVTALFRSMGSRLGILPMQRVVKELQRRGVDLRDRHGLDVYGGTGFRTTRHYAPRLGSLEVWEIEGSFEPELRRNLPGARVKITNSYEHIQRADGKYSFIALDSPVHTHGGHVEHFDLFPHIFRLMDDDCLLVIHVVSQADPRTAGNPDYTDLLDETQLARRRAFYQTDHPENIPLEQLARHYRQLLEKNGFTPEWHFFKRRWELRRLLPSPINMYYLALKVRRTRQVATDADRAVS